MIELNRGAWELLISEAADDADESLTPLTCSSAFTPPATGADALLL
jgi:hypothetical protein